MSWLALAVVLVAFFGGLVLGGVVFYQWTLTQRLQKHRKVLNFMGVAINKQERQYGEHDVRVTNLTVESTDLRARVERIEARLPPGPEPEIDRPGYFTGQGVGYGRDPSEEMGAPTVEQAVTIWERLLDESEG